MISSNLVIRPWRGQDEGSFFTNHKEVGCAQALREKKFKVEENSFQIL